MKSSINKQDNLLESLKYIKEAADRQADYIFFPEFQMAFSSNTQTLDELYNTAEPLANSKFIKKLCQYSKKYKIGIVGTFFEKNPYKTDKKVFDTAFRYLIKMEKSFQFIENCIFTMPLVLKSL